MGDLLLGETFESVEVENLTRAPGQTLEDGLDALKLVLGEEVSLGGKVVLLGPEEVMGLLENLGSSGLDAEVVDGEIGGNLEEQRAGVVDGLGLVDVEGADIDVLGDVAGGEEAAEGLSEEANEVFAVLDKGMAETGFLEGDVADGWADEIGIARNAEKDRRATWGPRW